MGQALTTAKSQGEGIQLLSKSWKQCRSHRLGEARSLQQAEIWGTDKCKSRAEI